MADRSMYRFLVEPRGRTYGDLIEFMRAHAEFGVLVVRDGESDSELVEEWVSRSSIARREQEWPGTILFDGWATVLEFRTEDVAGQILQGAVVGLYDWLMPDKPEDLAFLNEDRVPLLTSISHERESWMELSKAEWEAIPRSLKAIAIPD